MLIVLIGIPWWLGMLDLASALMATVVTIIARLLLSDGATWAPSRAAAPAWAAVGTLALMHLLGLAVAGTNSFTACLGWPLGVLDADRWPWLQVVRLLLAGAVLVLMTVAGRRVERSSSTDGAVRILVLGLLVELATAGVLLQGAGGLVARTVYAVAAAALFGATALLAGRASISVRAGETPGNDPIPAGRTAE
jgi:cytochrome c oxidase assembly protein subunit 15